MIRIILTYCLLAMATVIVAQAPDDEAFRKEAMNSCEKIIMFTDRNIYAVNESIHFIAFNNKSDALDGITWSQVLYVELVTPSGLTIASGKYFLEESGSSGSLAISADAVTGNYFLRSYTKWMRNFGPRSYCYVPLKIINPFRHEVQDIGNEMSTSNFSLDAMNDKTIACHTSKNTYSPGEEVNLELTLSDPGFPMPERYCLTIVPAGLADTASSGTVLDITGQRDDFRFDYLPDIRGISISGMVVKTEDQSPVVNARIHFSLMGDQPGYFAVPSDRQGRFILALPDRIGIQELFVACEPAGNLNHTLLVDHDFATDPVPIGTPSFTLSMEQEQAATRMAINMQLSMAYLNNEAKSTKANDSNAGIPFYGMPPISILTEEYIDLPTMTEVFENLVQKANVHHRRGKPFLRIESLNSIIAYYPPLLLVDNIPVFDQKAFLSVDPLKIKKVEVVNEVFVRGNLVFGGIIKLTSKKGDMAGVDLPSGSYFFDYQAYHPGPNSAPVSNAKNADRVPDTRNTLLWIDDLVLQANETKTMQFSAASGKGEYHILVRGVSNRGDIISGAGRFTVE